MFGLAGRFEPSLPRLAQRRLRLGAGRRGERDPDPLGDDLLLARPFHGAGRALQDLRRTRRRLRARRGLRHGGPQALERRPARRRPHPGGGARRRGESGRGQLGLDRAERAGAGAGDRPGGGTRGREARRDRLRRSARNGHTAGRSDRSASPAQRFGAHAGPDGSPADGVGQDQLRSPWRRRRASPVSSRSCCR